MSAAASFTGPTEAAAPPGRATPPTRRREPFWDNARFACLVLVVLGHALTRLTSESDAALALYLVVYAFHIPALAIISGYFSKSGAPDNRQMARVLTDIVVPYIIFQTIWTVVKWLVEGQANPDPTQPSWTLWFLLALAVFRLLLPYLSLLRWPLAWTFAIAIIVGYLPHIDSTLSLSRALGLLPFFMLGWWLKEHDIVHRLRLLRERPWWVPAVAVVLLVAAAVAASVWAPLWREVNLNEWFFYRETYASLGADQWWAGAVRVGLIAVALVLSAAFLALIPRGQQWWTSFGQYTLYIYLLHSFVLYPLRESGLLRQLEPMWLWLPVLVVGSVILSMALATRPVRTIFRPLVEPRPSWLFADRTLAARETRQIDPTGSKRGGAGG